MFFSSEKDLEDYEFKRVPANNKKGYRTDCIYIGEWYHWTLPAPKLRRLKILLTIYFSMILFSYLAGALQHSRMNSLPATAIAGLIFLFCLFFYAKGLVIFLFSKKQMKKKTLLLCKRDLLYSSAAGSLLMLFAAGSGFLSNLHAEVSFSETVSCLCYLLCSLLCLTAYRSVKQISYLDSKGNVPDISFQYRHPSDRNSNNRL